jgi:hypothetical protein
VLNGVTPLIQWILGVNVAVQGRDCRQRDSYRKIALAGFFAYF